MRKYPEKHIPVMPNEVVKYLLWKKEGIYVDCTVGEGGHMLLLAETSPDSYFIGIDIDSEVLQIAENKLAHLKNVTLFKSSYTDLPVILKLLSIQKVSGILIDLGISTFQIKAEGRGFSFNVDEPLDMRMNLEQAKTAHDVVNTYSEEKLADIIFQYGEERFARKIAKKIVENRPINTTFELVEAIKKALPYSEIRKRKRHFATKTFQAIRIEVNSELDNIKKFLEIAPDYLEKNGRLAIITFHSLEDRLAKHFIRNDPRLKQIAGPLKPSENEIKNNPRARSAKLRIAERI
ncbi:MAG: 16S rRNA (cytosine(1402)-N(4))-methyltransferase RsmH [Thermosipho sp. (in: Bacteria)]|nr:16S rRNA (cytosine(1402)-N(4))-methyltransferase RsmH [Thermosipho sp. (in: thermotogales)]